MQKAIIGPRGESTRYKYFLGQPQDKQSRSARKILSRYPHFPCLKLGNYIFPSRNGTSHNVRKPAYKQSVVDEALTRYNALVTINQEHDLLNGKKLIPSGRRRDGALQRVPAVSALAIRSQCI